MLGPEIAIPPMWDGLRPESTLKRYLKELDLWEAVTEIPKAKGAVKVYQALSGTVKEAVESLSVAELTSEDGVKQIRKLLQDAFSPYQETASPRAMETTIFGQPRVHPRLHGPLLPGASAASRSR